MADTLAVSLCATAEAPTVEQRGVPTPDLGVWAILTDIRKSLSTLTVPPVMPVVQTAAPVQAATPIVPSPALQGQGSSTAQVPTQDVTTQALLVVAQLLANIDSPSTPAPPTIQWATNDTLKNSVAELKHQVEAIVAVRSATSVPSGAAGLSVTPSPGVQPFTPNSIDKGKITESNNNTSGGVAAGARQDMLLSQPGSLKGVTVVHPPGTCGFVCKLGAVFPPPKTNYASKGETHLSPQDKGGAGQHENCPPIQPCQP
ncbi:hypothetical protein NDU88_004588 [Pleurodeles waltl]|uniref:Uncharacterized protein n=1 Tax=Pleurodeles waltl TaxID=8319 RepID=A0AAV7NPR3_PLEWA|nr:hypothetical protein NDU88_004588 [Pleurodeles waltl]